MIRLTFFLWLITASSFAQIVQPFELTNVLDGNTIALKNFESNPAVVLIVTTNTCPYTDYYIERIKALAERYKSKVPVLLINPNTDPTESIAEMARFANRHSLRFPYLADKGQMVLQNLNPRKNPEAFLLFNTSGKFKVVYRGAIDDNPQSASNAKHFYLQEAIDKVLASEKIETPDIRPVGCSVIKN